MRPGVVLITGGSRGIGAAIATAAAAAGWQVAITYREREAEAKQVLARIESYGVRGLAVAGDVADESDVKRVFDQAQALGPVRALVNNAGITAGAARVADATLEQFENVFRTNVIGTMLCAREAVRRLSTARGGPGGAIVNISSGAARTGSPGTWVHYAATKGAVDTFTLGLARELASEGIRVNAVRAGPTHSEMSGSDPARAASLAASLPMGRMAQPEEIAAAVMWLLDPAGSYVTAALIDAAGGL